MSADLLPHYCSSVYLYFYFLDATLVRRLASTSPGQGFIPTFYTTLPLLGSLSFALGCPKFHNQGTPLRELKYGICSVYGVLVCSIWWC